MKNGLHSKHLSKRLNLAMLIIVISLLTICIPNIFSAYDNYIQNKHALMSMHNLQIIADLTNKISRERAPSNRAMSSSVEELEKNRSELNQYRAIVDQHIQITIDTLQKNGYQEPATILKQQLIPALQNGRQAIDHYIDLPFSKRNMQLMDATILSMFEAWKQSYNTLRSTIQSSTGKNKKLNNYYTLILVLADLRDQAGRVASNIMAPVTFGVAMPEQNLGRSLQTQYQTQYLFDLINTISIDYTQPEEFSHRYQLAQQEFLGKGIPIIQSLIDDSLNQRPYSLSGTALTDHMVDKFLTIVELQDFVLQEGYNIAKKNKNHAQQSFVFTLLISSVAFIAALLTMIYSKRWVFNPLIDARNLLLALSQRNAEHSSSIQPDHDSSLFDAIQHLQQQLKQRDNFELQLKIIANTDQLTHVSNRLALDEYIHHQASSADGFKYTTLMMIDIDSFKKINDQYGHIFGDRVIKEIAKLIKNNVRPTDFVVRYGGDEFIVLIENISSEIAYQIAEQIRVAAASTALFPDDDTSILYPTLSIGIYTGAEHWLDLLRYADEALFKAKAKGKNQSYMHQ